jgi:hypothetical protein
MIFYLLLAWAVVRLVWPAFDRTETGIRRSVREEQTDIV